jgi:hypothetical protein
VASALLTSASTASLCSSPPQLRSFNAQTYELGASIIWGKNHYVLDAAKAVGLNPQRPQGSEGFMIFNGKEMLFSQVRRWLAGC